MADDDRDGYACRLCGHCSVRRTHTLREMFFGLRESFEYVECAQCGSLQISVPPPDLGRYYQNDYYSHKRLEPPRQASPARDWMRRQRAAYALRGRNVIGALLKSTGRKDYFDYPWDWFRRTRVGPASKILDVGCGGGALLFALRRCGFSDLTGVDPFRRGSEEFDGVTLRKATVFDIDGAFDLVMAHHSLEHMPDPFAALARMRDLARRGGYLLVRLPVLGRSWADYGANWVELDAPRHLFIPSVPGFRALADRVGGLSIEHVQFDSTAFELAGSELYADDVPLYPKELSGRSSLQARFDRATMQSFSERVERLNAEGTAGRAAFYARVGT